MGSVEVRSEKRGRKKRPRSPDPSGASQNKVRFIPRGKNLVGKYVKKQFAGQGIFLGKIVQYRQGLYKISYEDGDGEDLVYREICEILIPEENDSDSELSRRKKELDELIVSKSKKLGQNPAVSTDWSEKVGESSVVSNLSSDVEFQGDADSSSDFCESVRNLASEAPTLEPLPLPPSSGNIAVPEESIGYLFSVYNFLRSFSHQLFLSPFSLDDFVGSLNCFLPNTLLDSVFVSLMRALRRHLEMISSDGVERALKCLRRLDWSLLDTLTWPAYLTECFLIMGYAKGQDWAGFFSHVLDSDYYSLAIPAKLRILQILCDDVMESAELRADIDMRETAEVETEIDVNANIVNKSGPKRVHPRFSKTSACKDPETVENIVKHNQSFLGSKVMGSEVDALDVADDGNGDECRLCGMDGTVLCCDGCPLVYHSRCIGVNKSTLPKGSWYCPECSVKKIGPTSSRIGMGLKGAEVFGIDPHERVFLGSCNFLLVLGASVNAEPFTRYYSQGDVPNVLQLLSSSTQHAQLYPDICRGILQYWDLSLDTKFSHCARIEPDRIPLNEKEDAANPAPVLTFSGHEMHMLSDTVKAKCVGDAGECNAGKRVTSFQENGYIKTVLNNPSLNSVGQIELQRLKYSVICNKSDVQIAAVGCTNQKVQQVLALENSNSHEQYGAESVKSSGSVIMPLEPSPMIHQSFSERSIGLESATRASGDMDFTGKEDKDSLVLQSGNVVLSMADKNQRDDYWNRQISKGNMIDGSSCEGAPFKPYAYLNQYAFGDVAASAAANLAVLSSEDNGVSGIRFPNPRNTVSANTSLQIKAFAVAAMHFMWPSSERKLLELPRERCGWCIGCKAPASSKRGCLFNSAALNAVKGAARVLGSGRLIKNGEGHLRSIAAYILLMEEALRGLIVGSLLTANYRRQWRKQVEHANNCKMLKSLLLELEDNIRAIALSGGWLKPVDDWLVEFSTAQTAAPIVGQTQKRGSGISRNRKQPTTSDITSNPRAATADYVRWWRGGKVSKLVYQKGILPSSVVKKAARQGGYKRIFGISYAEGSEIPRRSRRFAWRAAVEMSKNASQLALQVRCLDAHVRWNDLVRPEQISQDTKGSEVEALAFRNAIICDKKIVESKIRYALDFGNQKHLPLRVMKNIVEEENQDGKEKLWFSENHIPLFLIKDYEGKVEGVSMCSSKKANHSLSDFQRRQVKASRKNIFSYLIDKREKLEKCSCSSCQQDVLLRHAVKCNSCEGFCHRDCVIPSVVDRKYESESMLTCSKCCHAGLALVNETPRNQLKTQVSHQAPDQIMSSTKSTGINAYQCHSTLRAEVEMLSEINTATPKSNSVQKSKRGTSLSYGLIWNKNKRETSESGREFRFNNILLRGFLDMDPLMAPICNLCFEPYNSDLMYIRCEKCSNWFHADALQLKEDQILHLVGFRCCKCRRRSSPTCPHMNPEHMKKHVKILKKHGSMARGQDTTASATFDTIYGKTEARELTIVEDDLLFSLENVQPILEPASEIEPERDARPLYQNQQKLQVRRPPIKNEKHESVSLVNPVHVEAATDETNCLNVNEDALSPQAEWKFTIDGELIDYESGTIDDEPQTYFSFTELLASDNGEMGGLSCERMDVSENWCSSSGCTDVGTVCQAMSPYNSNEAHQIGAEKSCQVSSVPIIPVPCAICTHTEPAPDLVCEICCMQIHHHCSKWVEPTSCSTGWRCGNCREWR